MRHATEAEEEARYQKHLKDKWWNERTQTHGDFKKIFK